ncbi:protein twisted gastrulation [Contarinia nasturtii]|uniref:protein twisted gastrulation n=1 Tax=Contarinia nasturtii TaxID=265458 RepID=UPI0012D3CF44|nr:protein twisted gastrulation [Contarinia nasturtii]XP_031626995.1 protein twisted gastrulation [Contarinia nasturtii]XP_031626996.1 protein twisted gastrulation [Contarinia nasturtii]
MATDYTRIFGVSTLAVFLLIVSVHLSQSCNEQVCASIVSKCMLTQSCKCDSKNYSCCSECFKCLGHLQLECCSCLEMCPKPTETRNVSRQSHIEDLEGIPGLFKALTEESDEDDDKWTTFTFPVDFQTVLVSPKDKTFKYIFVSADQNLDSSMKSREEIVTHNCTVVYMSQCLSSNKCKQNCESMGATSYRWFYDGCCECVGSTCINYGIKESRCAQCPESKDIDLLDEVPSDDELDFGENRL